MSSFGTINSTSIVSSCMYSSSWYEKPNNWNANETKSCYEQNEDDFYEDRVTAPKKLVASDGKGSKHVPHCEKPAVVVARRNARERRRVEAVNSAFAKLRTVLPIQNARGKRVSKVKTLQFAINYIQDLKEMLEKDEFDCQYFDLSRHHQRQDDRYLYDYEI